jgi:uncharacterized protein YndB with AHSA1/START domain
MGHIESTKTLSANPEAIWRTVSDPQTWDKWFTIHAGWLETPPSSLVEGAKLTEKILMLGMANKLEWTILECDAPNKIVLAGTGMAGVKVQFTFAIVAEGTGSSFTVSGDFDGALIKGALGKAVEKDGIKQLEKTLEQLDALASV